MAQLDRSVATLRISGDDLDPVKISALLGHAATKQQIKGEVFVGKVTGRSRIAKFGMWRLEAADAEPENLDEQISEILNKLTHDRNIWNELSMKYTMDLFCGLFMKTSNEGLSISAESLKALGARGIELSLDIYAPYEVDEEANA
jgi:hypothetical protein